MSQRRTNGIINAPTHGSAIAIRVVCLNCSWDGPRVDASGSCPACGGSLMAAANFRQPRRRVVVSRARFGERDAEVEARTDAALRRNREDAQR